MKLNQHLSKALSILAIVTGTLLSTSFNNTTVYASTSNASQSAINLSKIEKANPNSTTAKVSNDFKVTLNGKPVNLADPIVIDNGSTLLPVRAIANLLGIQVGYDDANKIAIATTENTTLEIPLGLTKAVNNGKVISINNNARSILYNSKTYLPIRFVSEQLKISIDYLDPTKTIVISTNGPVVTPTATATQGKSPQEVFDSGREISLIDPSYLKSFTSPEQVKELLPNLNSEYAYKFTKYAVVETDITSQRKIIDDFSMIYTKNAIGLVGPGNTMVRFKDGTWQKGMGDFKDGKKLEDVSYFSFSRNDRIILIVKVNKVDTSSFKF